MRTAEFWRKTDGDKVRCDLCPHHCKLAEGQAGLCKVRIARDGELKAAGYGHISSAHVDPIEKKPLYHFLPGSSIFSIGGWGCNFACEFCQNWTISQEADFAEKSCAPEEIVRTAVRSGCPSIAYTYNEPLVGFEFVCDCARLAREAGLANVLVTNGHVEPEPAAELLPLVRALNVDIKSIEEEFYRKHCRGRLAPVLGFCRQAKDAGCLVEITNLLIPSLNDNPGRIRDLAHWVKENLGPAAPFHLSAYRPEYRMTIPPTPRRLLEEAFDICSEELSYVYVGNVWTEKGQNTRCPSCGRELIIRRGYDVEARGIRDGACAGCGRKADVVMTLQN